MINLLSGIESTSSALNAERIRMEVVSQNIANAYTTHDVNGKPYQREVVVFETHMQKQASGPAGENAGAATVNVARIQKLNTPPRMVYNPGHPDADSRGMVAMPDINIHEEMVDLITSSRAYEANLAAVKNARSIAMQTLGIGKR